MKSKISLNLESLDRREVPASLAHPPLGVDLQVRVPVPEGCWPGPPPVIREANFGQIVISPDFGSIVVDPGQKTLPSAGM